MIPNKTLYQTVSSIPGRIRWRVPGLLKNSACQQSLKKNLQSLKGVTNVRINSVAESIIVTFSATQLSSHELQQQLDKAIAQAAYVKPSLPPVAKDVAAADKTSFLETKAEKPITQETIFEESVSSSLDFWREKCQEQGKIIEDFEQQLAYFLSSASIGANLLNKWRVHNLPSSKSKPPKLFSTPPSNLPSLETLQKEGNWEELAKRQAEKILQLQQQVSEQQRLSAFAETHLNKWRYRFFR